MTRWSLLCLMSLALCTACPETWREGGTIDRAMAKDVQDGLHSLHKPPDCQMSDEQWALLCDPVTNPVLSSRCAPGCHR